MADTDTPLTILYFAWLRERVGTAAEELPLPPSVATVADLVEHLAARGPGMRRRSPTAASVRCAVNQEFAPVTTSLHPGDEVAFFPPVTGG